MSRVERIVRALFGERPRAILFFVAPTALAIVMDVALRGRTLAVFPPKEWLNYLGSSLASAGFWGGPLWLASRLFVARGPAARVGLALFATSFVLPLAVFSYGGQALYFKVFGAYMARDTVRLGIALRGTLGAWLASWGASGMLLGAIGAVVATVILACARRGAPAVRGTWPVVPALGFAIASYCFWIDFVESRSLQAAPPDTCFIHGVMHAVHDAVTGKGWARRGISLREPAPLPPLTPAAHRPNVLLVISESVRADAMCSARSALCVSRFFDDAIPERAPLGRLTVQSSGTFTSCVLTWTGLAPDADFATMHHAPVLWEMARAVGYRTAYIGSQNLRYDDFSAFLTRAGIDVLVSAAELGGAPDPHVGAPDEDATARMLAYVKDAPADHAGRPYFAVLHLSNTHWPYRVARDLQPYAPHDDGILDTQKLRNHYKNSVLMQERTMARFFDALKALPGWDDTVVLFVSDHGEEFREHGGLYHLTSLFEEQVRVPGFLVAGARALDPAQRAALDAWRPRRTYSQDVHATVLDLIGVLEQRHALPFADRVTGRSLVRPPSGDEPMVLMSTASGVWAEPDNPKYGVMRGDLLAVRGGSSGWLCYDARVSPSQTATTDIARCREMIALGDERFAR